MDDTATTNAPGQGVSLLDDEANITDEFERALKHIFAKYCVPASTFSQNTTKTTLLTPLDGAYFSPEGLDAWARDTNGEPFNQDTKDEILEFMDVTDGGDLTFKGFMQVYQLQTENDEEETWRDLAKHGFDRELRLVSTANGSQ